VRDQCPNCGEPLEIVYQPSSNLYKKIGLADAMYCAHCHVRLSKKVSHLSLVLYLPYACFLIWNIFVHQFGQAHYGLEKLGSFWVGVAVSNFHYWLDPASSYRYLQGKTLIAY